MNCAAFSVSAVILIHGRSFLMQHTTNPNGKIGQTIYRAIIEFLKRHLLVVGTGAVVVMLSAIIGLQLYSLERIELFWGAYAQLWRQSYLSEVAGKVETHYRDTAKIVFDESLDDLSDESLKQLETRFVNSKVDGVRRLFVVRWNSAPYDAPLGVDRRRYR